MLVGGPCVRRMWYSGALLRAWVWTTAPLSPELQRPGTRSSIEVAVALSRQT